MKTLHEIQAAIFVAFAWILLASMPAIAALSPTFEKDIRPILKAHCFECHGEGENRQSKADASVADGPILLVRR